MSLADEMSSRVARYADRREDWTVFGFETQLEPKFARSQRRYIGASGSVDHVETNAVSPVAFTMSIQTMPPGNRIPVQCGERGSALLNERRQDDEPRSYNQDGHDKRAQRSSSRVPVSWNLPLVPGVHENGENSGPP